MAESTSSTEVVEQLPFELTTAMRYGRKQEAESLPAHRHGNLGGLRAKTLALA
ncbi:hypothetical protein PTKU15_93130 [Paraburkholderia terrae]|nr:hypothetical protein PTKU15_93130 [Paraburkholderia terrae]